MSSKMSLVVSSFVVAVGCAAPFGSGFAQPAETAPPALLLPVGTYELYSNKPNGGYHVNRYGFGQYTRGTDGGFGGYPAGSAGAQELREQQRRKCDAVPEEC